MVQPRKWIPGLLPLGVLVMVAALWRQGGVEQDLAARADGQLKSAGLAWSKTSLSGRDLKLEGEAPSPEARAQAISVADGVFGVRLVASSMTVLPEAKPFTFTALRDGAKITLTGVAPPGAGREKLIDAAGKAAANLTVVDELRNARGESGAFEALAAYGLGELGKLSQGTMSISDSMLSISGRAADLEKYADIRAKLAALPAGGTLGKGLAPGDILPPIVKPFGFQAEIGTTGIMLSGYYPSEAAHEKLLAAARALGVPVKDSLRIADGAPSADWDKAAATLLTELGKLESGKIALVDANAMIVGKARGLVAEEDVRADLRALPPGYPLVQVAIESRVVRPFRFEAQRKGEVLTLSGYVPDAKTRAAILETVKQYFEGDRVEDKLAEGLGEPKGFQAAVQEGLQELSRLADGASLAVSDNLIALKGLALFDAARDQISKAFLQGLPGGFQSRLEVATAPLPPQITELPQCQTLYTDLLKRGTIRFKSGSADLSDASRAILDRLAVVSLRCVSARIEIGGHTDNDGSPLNNAELSRRRAETVGAYLVLAGVPVERLEPVGYGQTVPVAPNDSPENKAKNRRIEFFVK
jgi:OmpA-OmpF porin, OOP family